MLGEHVIQKTDNILMSTDCAPPLVDLFLYLHEACNSRNMNRLAGFFNFMFRYIADDVLSLIIQNLVIMLITSIASCNNVAPVTNLCLGRGFIIRTNLSHIKRLATP